MQIYRKMEVSLFIFLLKICIFAGYEKMVSLPFFSGLSLGYRDPELNV